MTHTQQTAEHTQCLLVAEGNLAAVTNCNFLTDIVDGDAVDRTGKSVTPDSMIRPIVLGRLSSSENHVCS